MRFCSRLGNPRCRLARLSGEDDVMIACILRKSDDASTNLVYRNRFLALLFGSLRK